jgi:hypothetical protein
LMVMVVARESPGIAPMRVLPAPGGQRQPEVRGYCSQALSLVPTAGAIQTSISTMRVMVRDRMAMSIGFTVTPAC